MGISLADIFKDRPTLADRQGDRNDRYAPSKAAMTTRREDKSEADKDDEKQLKAWRKAVTARDGMKCRWCRCKVVASLEALANQSQTHHATPREHKPTRYDVRNGIRVCGTCHDRLTGTVGEKAIIVAAKTFTLNGRAYPDMTKGVQFKVIVEKQPKATV